MAQLLLHGGDAVLLARCIWPERKDWAINGGKASDDRLSRRCPIDNLVRASALQNLCSRIAVIACRHFEMQFFASFSKKQVRRVGDN
jgi:hypothetical protein